MIKQQKTGLVFPIGEVIVLKEAIEFAFVKRDVLTNYAEVLFEEIVDKFDRKIMQQLQLEAYRKLGKYQEKGLP